MNKIMAKGSDEVVMSDLRPDITEVTEADPLAMAADREPERPDSEAVTPVTSVKNSRVSRICNDSNGVVSVPVSLPVGTLIAGTAFNVITSDQLPNFKPMLCIDNGFVSGGRVGEEMKSHIVIQNPPSPATHADEGSTSASRAASTRSWAETASMPVLPIRCKNTSAELHKNKFGSGGRGRCIKYANEWYTPNEFEALCGRGLSKDWKRSIRFGGRSIQALIDEAILTPHATGCTCGVCCDDQTAIGPVRLFTPYKRKRRTNHENEEKRPKLARNISESDVEPIHSCSNHSSPKEAWQSIAERLETTTDYHILEKPDNVNEYITGLPEMEVVLKRLDDIGSTLVRLAGELKQCTEEARAVSARHLERLEHERASVLLATSVDSDHVPLHSVDDAGTKKCANCNREALAECSLCRRTPYCSTYCQKKDWGAHQLECLRAVPSIQADPSQHQSIMLIVESQHH